jgi:membrane associated rhomboid family serine protease
MFPMPPAIRSLLLINVAVWALQLLDSGGVMERYFALWPVGSPEFEPWQVLTYAFLHDPSNPMHLLFNMLALVSIGGGVERTWGRNRFLTYYMVCVLSAAATQLFANAYAGSAEPTVGASGGVFGVLLAFGMLFPRRIVMLLFPPIPMPAWLFVPLMCLGELYFGVTGSMQGVAHFAHLGGAFGGWLMIMAGRRMRGRRSDD